MSRENPEKIKDAASSESRFPQFSARVMVVEDHPSNWQVLNYMLRKFGLEAGHFKDGSQAVEWLERNDCDLVFMDMEMPDMDGLEATRIIRSPESAVRNHSVPVVAVTAHALRSDRNACFDAGMNDYLAKPFTLRLLGEILQRWLPGKKA